ncbi:MAG: hypothetical protein J3K34DRAFT_521103 [Monoraphidium minutum]|nr:MAG: hypothetical protein J3K34DRAFT_521103 [Monoraphidium minutum]
MSVLERPRAGAPARAARRGRGARQGGGGSSGVKTGARAQVEKGCGSRLQTGGVVLALVRGFAARKSGCGRRRRGEREAMSVWALRWGGARPPRRRARAAPAGVVSAARRKRVKAAGGKVKLRPIMCF